ncbi:MAG TPA: YjbQ family protein [Firmicutes bacterium]|nr:YjbQ family protein [Bacillota bacterium]
MEILNISTSKREELIDITGRVKAVIKDVSEGIVFLYVPHTTAALTCNENADPSVKSDIIKKMSSLVPEKDNYKHMEGNSDAHVKTSLFGGGEFFIISGGGLMLGEWQGIYFAEFDGPRKRKVYCSIIKS